MTTPAADHASPSAHQTSHGRLSGVLRGAMWVAVESGPGVGSIEYRASAALNALLAAHPVDQGGRCRSCRRPRALLGRRRRRCQIYWTARYWLNQPEEALSHLASERHLDARPPWTDKDHPDSTDVLPAIEPDLGVPLHTPTVPPPLPPRRCPRAGRPGPGSRWDRGVLRQQPPVPPCPTSKPGHRSRLAWSVAAARWRPAMTDRVVIEDARREQLLPDAMLSPDIRLPLAAVEPEQRGERVAEATRVGDSPPAVLGPVPHRTQR
jgi:hypothetical protein